MRSCARLNAKNPKSGSLSGFQNKRKEMWQYFSLNFSAFNCTQNEGSFPKKNEKAYNANHMVYPL
jgi:hypothetical protein